MDESKNGIEKESNSKLNFNQAEKKVEAIEAEIHVHWFSSLAELL